MTRPSVASSLPGRGALLALTVCVAAAYLPSIHGGFVFDDVPHIPESQHVTGGNVWPLVLEVPSRALPNLTFAANWALGNGSTTGFHVVSVALHILTSITVAAVGGLLGLGPAGATVAMFFFALHPVQTQPVSYVWQRVAVMCALFMLLSLMLLLRSQVSTVRRQRAACMLAAVLAGFAACFSKETAASLPALGVLLLAHRRPLQWRSLIPAAWLIVPVSVLLILAFGAADSYTLTQAGAPSRATYSLTQLHVIFTYLRLVVAPYDLRLMYSYPLTATLDASTVAAAIVLLALVFASLWLFIRHPIPGGALLWMLLALFPESGAVPIRHVIFEHRLYLPLAGVAWAAGWAFERTHRLAPSLRFALAGALALTAMAVTSVRNLDWRTPAAVWNSNLEVDPANATARINLAGVMVERGMLNEAALLLTAVIHDSDESAAFARRNLCVLALATESLGDHRRACRDVDDADIPAELRVRLDAAKQESPDSQ